MSDEKGYMYQKPHPIHEADVLIRTSMGYLVQHTRSWMPLVTVSTDTDITGLTSRKKILMSERKGGEGWL